MVLNLKILSESWWIEITRKIDKSAVFIDDPAAECLHWHGGLPRLIKAGASLVKQFSSFENAPKEEKKAVFITSNPVVGSVRMILRDIISNSSFEHCILITACSPVALTLATTGNVIEGNNEMTATLKLELDMLHWMKNKDFTVEIFNFPMSFISITDHIFSMPPLRDLFPFFEEDFEGKMPSKHLQKNIGMESLPLELQVCIIHLVTTLNSLLTQLNVKEDIHYMGSLSSLIASQLQNFSSSSIRTKTATTKMSVIIIDRNLDLASATNYNSECLFDKIRTVLPCLPGHDVDVAINMSSVCASKVSNNEQNDGWIVAPGCLHQPGSEVMDFLFCKKQKDVLLSFYKELISKGLKSKLSPRVTTHTLHKMLMELSQNKRDFIYENAGLVQEIMGVVTAINSPKMSMFEFAESIQKLLLQSVAAENSTNGAIKQIQQLITSRKERGLTIDILVSIMVYFYALIGTQFDVDADLEIFLMWTFSKAIFEDKDNLSASFLSNLSSWSENITSKEAEELGQLVFNKLNSLRTARKDLINYKYLSKNMGPLEPLIFNDLISQLLTDLVDPKRPEIPDLVHTQSDSLRSRFSMLLNQSKPHPMDNDNILVLLVGGITGQEARMIKDCFQLHKKTVFVGSTSLVTPISILNKIFVKDPLKPYLL